MPKVLILGAGGQIARHVIDMLAGDDTIQLTLFLREARRIKGKTPAGARVVEAMSSTTPPSTLRCPGKMLCMPT